MNCRKTLIVTDLTEYGEDGVNLDRPGKYKGKIEIEYPDGSTKELTVPIRVLKDEQNPVNLARQHLVNRIRQRTARQRKMMPVSINRSQILSL